MRWAIAFVTMERPTAAQRFVQSARRVFPDAPMYVADQSRTLGFMAEFYQAERVTVVRMPFDAGLSASRNALVEAMDVDYFALCDDDFVLGPATSFGSAINVLEEDAELGVVGGLLHERDGEIERIRNWEMFFDHDERHGRFTATPIYNYPPISRDVAGETVYLCDAVMNFAVFRRAMFASGMRWEERIKINGEHEDFYLTLKKTSPCRVAYLPSMAALHWPVEQHGQYATLRVRDEGTREFMRKWGLTSHLEIGTGGRPLDGAQVRDWFVWGDGGGDTTSRSMPQTYGSSLAVPAGIAHMRLNGTVEPKATSRIPSAAEHHHFFHWLTPDASPCQPIAAGQLLFCYQPGVDLEGDLLLWYRAISPRGRANEGAHEEGVVLRWFSSSEEALVWESDVQAIRGSEGRYWQPLAARIPPWPRASGYLRFEVVSADERRGPLAAGFIFSDSQAGEGRRPDESPGVLALSRTTAAAAGVEISHQPLAALLASAPRVEMEFVRRGEQPWVTLNVSRLDFLGLSGGGSARPALMLAAGARRVPSAPVHLALPLSLLLDPDHVFFASGPGPTSERLFIVEPRLVEVAPTYGPAVFTDAPLHRGARAVSTTE